MRNNVTMILAIVKTSHNHTNDEQARIASVRGNLYRVSSRNSSLRTTYTLACMKLLVINCAY